MRSCYANRRCGVDPLLFGVVSSAQFADPNHETTTSDVPGLTAETSKCSLSTDPMYGLTKENAIKTGGGAAYMASRDVKFLSALRGPAASSTQTAFIDGQSQS